MFPTKLQNQFESLCYGQLSRPEAEAVLLRLAQIFKEQGKMPSLTGLTEAALQRGGYVLDLFSAMLPVEPTLKVALRTSLAKRWHQCSSTFQTLSFYPEDKPTRGDEVAKRWQLASGMRPAQVPGLLDLQRRAKTDSGTKF